MEGPGKSRQGRQEPSVGPPDFGAEPPLGGIGAPGQPAQIDPRPGVLEAELNRYQVGTDRIRKEGENARKQVEAKINHDSERLQAEISDQAKRTDAETKIDEDRAQAEIGDQARRTSAEMTGLEGRDRTTVVERYFWMVVVAVGIIATIVLAFVTADSSALKYHLTPTAGLLISGGGGLRLRALTRAQPVQPEKR